MMKRTFIFLLLVFTITGHAQEFRFQKGVIINEVPMVSDSTSTYALYLPTSFEMNTKWPVLFVFDPEGNGRRGVAVFKEVAEQYGFMVVSSNTIKNDLLEKNLKKFDKLSLEIGQTFPVNSTRVFTAGYSGAARLATTIAVITGKIEAVIACGASFSSNVLYYPNKPNFYFIGITGDADFNNIEMRSARSYLEGKKIPNELFVFEGGHEWPEAKVISEAFKWIQFRYLRKYNKLQEQDVEKRYLNDLEEANNLSKFDKEKAINYYDRIRENYKFVFDTDSLKKKIRLLKKDPLYKARHKKDELAILEEEDLRSMYVLYFQEDLEVVNFDNLSWWESQLQQIDSFTKSKDYFRARTGKRLQGLLFTAAKEVSMALKDSTNTEKWLYSNIFMTLANKKYEQAYLNIIQYGARKLDYDLALFYTNELFKHGFTDLTKLYELDGASLFFVSPEYLEMEDSYFRKEEDNME